MTVKEAVDLGRMTLEQGVSPWPIHFKGTMRWPEEVYAGLWSLETVFMPRPGYTVKLQDRHFPTAFIWVDMAACEIMKTCKSCPVYNDETETKTCGNCPLYEQEGTP